MLMQHLPKELDRVIELELGLFKNPQTLQGFGIVGVRGKHLPVNALGCSVVPLALVHLRLLEQSPSCCAILVAAVLNRQASRKMPTINPGTLL